MSDAGGGAGREPRSPIEKEERVDGSSTQRRRPPARGVDRSIAAGTGNAAEAAEVVDTAAGSPHSSTVSFPRDTEGGRNKKTKATMTRPASRGPPPPSAASVAAADASNRASKRSNPNRKGEEAPSFLQQPGVVEEEGRRTPGPDLRMPQQFLDPSPAPTLRPPTASPAALEPDGTVGQDVNPSPPQQQQELPTFGEAPLLNVSAGASNEEPNRPSLLPVAVAVDTSGVPNAALVLAHRAGGDSDEDGDEDGNLDDESLGNDNENNDSSKIRRRRLVLGTLAVLGLVALAVGLTVGRTAPSNGTEPPPQFVVDSRCYDEYDAFGYCTNTSRTSGCGNCISSYYSSVLHTNLTDVFNVACPGIDDETCDALAACSDACGPCAQPFLPYFECASQCSLSGTPCKAASQPVPLASNWPTTTPSPTLYAVQKCRVERDAFSQCANRTGTVSECYICEDDRLSVAKDNDCPEFRKVTCELVGGCPACGDCEDAYLVYWDCVLEGQCASLNCSSFSPRPSTSPRNA